MTEEAKKTRLFPFYLEGSVKRWYKTLDARKIQTWVDFKQAFMKKYCPLKMAFELINDILRFKEDLDEKLAQSWEKMQDMVKRCPQP